jgi:deazaflavin-dependent oxidoreductase (nitroreductase family)
VAATDPAGDQTAPPRLGNAEIRAAAAKEEPSHKRLIRSAAGGRAVSAMTLPYMLLLPPAGYGVLTTTGRKSGKPRRKCLRAVRRGDKAYLSMIRPPIVAVENPSIVTAWVLNLRANPAVRLRIRGGTFDGVAREINDEPELREAREAFCETVVPFDYLSGNLHLRGIPTRAKILRFNRYWFDTGIPLAVELS